MMLKPTDIERAISVGKSFGGDKPAPVPSPIRLNNGQLLTVDQFNQSAKNGLPFTSMQTMADYINGWARKLPPTFQASPYYRTHGGDNIPGGDVALLFAKHMNNPEVMKVLNRNIAGPGEVPMYGPEDSDIIKQLIASNNAK